MTQSGHPSSFLRRLLDALFQEPLIPFAVIGGLLFAVYGLTRPAERETIEVTPQTVQTLEDLEVDLRGRPLTDEERKLLVESYIEDEVLMHEAFRMGLERKDSRVRKRLLSVMRTSLDEPVAEPNLGQLQEYYRKKMQDFQPYQAISFDQVCFSFGAEPANASELIQQLNSGVDHTQLGEFQILGPTVRAISENDLRRTCGSQFTAKLLSADMDQWFGPVESAIGSHFVRVTEKRQVQQPEFQQMEDYLRQEWMFTKRREIQTRKIAELKKGYRIEFKED